MAIVGREIGSALCEALGLPGRTSRVEIVVPCDAPVEVVCRYYPTIEQMSGLVELLQRYEVQAKEAPRVVAHCEGAPVWRILPRDAWQMRLSGDEVQVGAFVDATNTLCWLTYPLSSLPNHFVGLDDLEKAGIFINNVDAMAG